MAARVYSGRLLYGSPAHGVNVCSLLNSDLQGAHCEERLRIEIVNLREQLDTRTEENGLWVT